MSDTKKPWRPFGTTAAGGTSSPGAPSAHAATHKAGGSDPILGITEAQLVLNFATHAKLHAASHSDGGDDEVDVTDLAGYPGGTTRFLRADGTFNVPPGSGSGGGAYMPLCTGAEPLEFVSNGAGAPMMLAFTP